MRTLSIAIALTFLVGCGGAAPLQPEPLAPPLALDQILDRLRVDDAALMAELAQETPMRREPIENRHVEGQIDSLAVVTYPGLEVVAYEIRDGATFVQSVAVTGPQHRTASGLGVGRTREEIEATTGAPVTTIDEEVLYEVGSGYSSVTLNVLYGTDGRAERLVWFPYLD